MPVSGSAGGVGCGSEGAQAWQLLQPCPEGPVPEKGPGLWAGSKEDESGHDTFTLEL